MQVQNLVQATANHVRITQLAVGDCFKRLVEDAYSKPELRYGFVTSILNDGETTVVAAMELDTSIYGSEPVKPLVFKSGQDETIFPATPEEIAAMTSQLIDVVERKQRDAERDLEKKRDQVLQVNSLVSKLRSGELAAPQFENFEVTA